MPQYRGAAPINWAVINGETQTGVTTFFLDHDIDTGRIILKKTFDIPDEADVEYVYDGLMHLGAEICLETLEAIVAANGHPDSIPQDSVLDGSAIKPAPKIFKETCEIDWKKTAKQVYDFVRGLSPYPGAWTTGTITIEGKALCVSAADEQLEIVELQLAGKKRMMARDFLNGMKQIEDYRVK